MGSWFHKEPVFSDNWREEKGHTTSVEMPHTLRCSSDLVSLGMTTYALKLLSMIKEKRLTFL